MPTWFYSTLRSLKTLSAITSKKACIFFAPQPSSLYGIPLLLQHHPPGTYNTIFFLGAKCIQYYLPFQCLNRFTRDSVHSAHVENVFRLCSKYPGDLTALEILQSHVINSLDSLLDNTFSEQNEKAIIAISL